VWAEHGLQPGFLLAEYRLQSERMTSVAPSDTGARSSGLLFPAVPALVAREGDGFVLVDGFGASSRVRGRICREIEEALAAGAATAELSRLSGAHPMLAELVRWLGTTAVPLTREGAVRLDGFDTLFLELLGQCNERCLHCYADSAPSVNDALEAEVVFSVIEQAAAAGFRRIQFTGGDPLLCSFLPEAVALASERGIAYREIYTNGLALGDRLLDALAPSRPSFAFSFYSLDPEVHDRITRTPGSQRRTLAAIDRVVSRGLTARAAIVVMEENAEGVDELVEFLRGRGLAQVSWSRTFAVGRGVDMAGGVGAIASNGWVRGDAPHTPESGGHRAVGDAENQLAGKLCVTYTGDVVPCIFQRQSVLGNVKGGRSLLDILGAERQGGNAGFRLPVAAEARQRLQCSSCRLTDMALGWLGSQRSAEKP
jgi:MoaA/NifB/PqqE/SkfB family radical SAM enzyme